MSSLPKDILKLSQGQKIMFYSLIIQDDGRPLVAYSITVFQDLTFLLYCRTYVLEVSTVSHIVTALPRFRNCSEVANVIVHVKNVFDQYEAAQQI